MISTEFSDEDDIAVSPLRVRTGRSTLKAAGEGPPDRKNGPHHQLQNLPEQQDHD